MRKIIVIVLIINSIKINAQKKIEISFGSGINNTHFNVLNSFFYANNSSGSATGNQFGGTLKFRVYKNLYVGTGWYKIQKQYSYNKLQPFAFEDQNYRIDKIDEGVEIPFFISIRKRSHKSNFFFDFSLGLCYERATKFKKTIFTNSGLQTANYTENFAFSRTFVQPKIAISYQLPKNLNISVEPFFNLDRAIFSKSITDTFIIHNSGINLNIGISL